jgi:drug/metabolite transporter (DMT)-like permease
MHLGRLAFLSPRAWFALLFLGLFCSGVAYIFYYDALKAIPASRVGSLIYLEPLVTMGCAAAMLGEAPGEAMVLGGVAILAGVWMVNRPAAG